MDKATPTPSPASVDSAQGRALASAWAEGWTQCRDAEYAGEEAQSEAFNQSYTLAQCLHADQTRLQGGLSNDQLRRAWGAKLPRVIPTDEQLTAFALGIEVAVAQSAPLAQQAAEPTYTDDLELRYAEVCEERDHLRAVLRAQSPAQAPVQPVSLTDVLQAAAPTEIADALAPVVQAGEPGKYDDVLKPFFTLMERELHANSGKGDRSGWLAMKPDQALLEVYHHVAKLAKAVRDNDGPGIMEYGADVANMAMMVLDLCGSLAWVDADRASSGAAQAVASLTAQRNQALARVAELEKDAARYRWLRSVPNAFKAQRIVNDTPHGMDATIDAAMNGGNQ